MDTSSFFLGPGATLLTDLYQLTMAYGFWKLGMAEREAVFYQSFRRLPFRSGYAVACGQESLGRWLSSFSLSASDLSYLAGLRGNDDAPLFESGFFDYLESMRFSCDVDAVPEGTAVFPYTPVVRVRGPMVQCQIIETPLLNIMNFQTLIATKAARICLAAGGQPVLEFGLRRAHGPDGGVSASRAAYIGGCSGTSNVLAGKMFGIPVKGTIAHSWVMAFDREIDAFMAYARALPNNCILLVDTYDTVEGVRKAVETAKWLRDSGHRFMGVRLDSGDLADLSRIARKILDENGFPDAWVVASNDLDEYRIQELKARGAAIDAWGVGTRMVTAFDQPALDGVYKLSAMKGKDGVWNPKIKLSEQEAKITTPGVLQVRRFQDPDGGYLADMVFDLFHPPETSPAFVGISGSPDIRPLSADLPFADLLVPLFRGGRSVHEGKADLDEVRGRVQREISRLSPETRRLADPSPYPVGLERRLHEMKQELIQRCRMSAGV